MEKTGPVDPHDLINQWLLRVSRMKDAHYEAATHFERLNLALGIPVIILSTIVGTTIFASLQKTTSTAVQVAAGLLSIVAAVLASLQTFLRYSERAEKHHLAGAKYGTLKAELERLKLFLPPDTAKLEADLKAFDLRWSAIREQSPTIPEQLWKRISNRQGIVETGSAS